MPLLAAAQSFRRSRNATALQLSEIVQITEAAKAMRASGQDILSFSTGEPDFPTPDHVIEATCAAIRNGAIAYPATQGTLELRRAICDSASSDLGGSPDPADVIVSNGVKQVLSNALQATLDPDDEVILPAPYWTSYADMISFARGKMVSIQCDVATGFALTPEQLEAAITPRTRWLILNSPGNPSGRLYSAGELAALAEVLRRHPQVWVMADEIYQHIAYAPFRSFREVAPDLAHRTLIANGVSKAYAMMGWRIGWGIGPVDLIQAMVAVQGQATSGASAVSQIAATVALTSPQDLLRVRCASFRARRDLVVAAVNAVPGLSCITPGGAFCVFPSCSGIFGARTPQGLHVNNDADYCRYILESGKVALVPGRAFGMPGFFRLSYAYANSELVEGCNRISAATQRLTNMP